MPKQVGLIIPRGPFLNLEWFVGLLKGDNWIHTELAAGMHTQSAVECECSRSGIVSHPEICTYKSQCPCTTPHKWLQWKGRDRVGTGSWVTHPLVPARRRPTFLWENLWNARVNSHVCTWASRTIWVGAGKKWGVCVGLRTFHAGYPGLCCMHACMQGCAFENLSIEFQTVRKSTRMWGLSRAINEPRSTFLVRGMSTSRSFLHNSFELWLTQHHPSHADADLYNICSNSFESNYSHYST